MPSLTAVLGPEVVLAIAVTWLIARGLYRLRSGLGSKRIAISACVGLYLICAAAAVGHAWMWRSSDRYLLALQKPAPPVHLVPDWGSTLSAETRTKYSANLARLTFESWGEVVDYFDASGHLAPYEPSSQDRQMRVAYVERIRLLERQLTLLFYVGIGWLLLPLLAIGLAFGRRSEWLFRPRSAHSSTNVS